MVEIQITEEQRAEAKRLADELGVLNKSITSGQGNLIGFLGEQIVIDYTSALRTNTFDYDMTKDGVTADVKSKKCSSPPLPDYECSVSAINTSQKTDYYIFVRILE